MAADVRRKAYALYSQVGDSYFFTSTQHAENFDITTLSLDTDVHLLEVIPFLSSAENVVPLGYLSPHKPSTPSLVKPRLPNSETMPVQFLNYGPYLTFAPTMDTTAATLTLEETVRAQQYRMQQLAAAVSASTEEATEDMENEQGDEAACTVGSTADTLGLSLAHEPKVPSTISVGNESTPMDVVTADGIDVNALEYLPHGGTDTTEERTHSIVDEILKQNSELLAALARLQDQRLASDTPEEISKEEIALASLVTRGLASLANMTEPSQLMTSEVAERTMIRFRRFDAAYRGTLPEGRLNAFSAGAASSINTPVSTTEPATPVVPGKAHHGRQQEKEKGKTPATTPASKA